MWTGKSLILWSFECEKSHKYRISLSATCCAQFHTHIKFAHKWNCSYIIYCMAHWPTHVCINQMQERRTGGNLSLDWIHRNIFFVEHMFVFVVCFMRVLVWWVYARCVYVMSLAMRYNYTFYASKKSIRTTNANTISLAKRWFAN